MLAVIIVSYKSSGLTAKFVLEELSKINIPYKVVVVCNASDADECDFLAASLNARVLEVSESSSKAGSCFIINNHENSGFAKGNNIGARFAIDVLGAEKLLFSNNDIRFLDNDVVERLANVLDSMPEVGIVGPKILGLDGRLQSPEPYMSFAKRHIWMYLLTPFISKSFKASLFNFNYPETAEEGFHYKLMGSFFMVRSSDFISCDMMDEGTFLYSEETILTERMLQIGLRPYYLPSVSVLHEHGKTISTKFNARKRDELQFESEVYYYRKYKSVGYFQIFISRIIRKILYLVK